MITKSTNSSNDMRPEISPDIIISDIVEYYPEVVEMLITEYGFHCVQCIVSGYESLRDGARVHGIIEEEFDEMMEDIQKRIDGEEIE